MDESDLGWAEKVKINTYHFALGVRDDLFQRFLCVLWRDHAR